MIADKGGFVFGTKTGAYDNIAEFDFVSLYPSIMFKKNISYETINCHCCKYKLDNKVPGLEHLYYICKKNMNNSIIFKNHFRKTFRIKKRKIILRIKKIVN
ncbi:MAG TPA: DNA polymerase domain-containing protein [Verrucomicrobiae bacterium]|nr:DNA polymerase domain-containing protein [Verrucomicrobiae bacterium]